LAKVEPEVAIISLRNHSAMFRFAAVRAAPHIFYLNKTPQLR